MSDRFPRLGGLPAWLRRPALTVALLVVAVTVSVLHGQPSPASRPSGVSVPVRTQPPAAGPPAVGTLLLIASGQLIRFDTQTRQAGPLSLPKGIEALRAWTVSPNTYLVFGRQTATGRTAGYLVRVGRATRLLGAAEAVLPTANGAAAWLLAKGRAVRIPFGAGRPLAMKLPIGSRLVGDTPYGLIVSTGTVPAEGAPPAPRPPTPSVTPTVVPTGSRTPVRTTSPRVPTPTSPTPTPTVTPTTTPAAVPITTWAVTANGRGRLLADNAEGLAVASGRLLLRREDRQLGVLDLRTPTVPPATVPAAQWLPDLSAVEVTGPGTVYPDGGTFAVLARVNEHARLVVGPTDATGDADLKVVALEGGSPEENPAPPSFTASGRVLVTRPDGRVVYYLPGERTGALLGDDIPAATFVAQA